MKPLYKINDIHTGVIRNTGTTPTTAWKLRQYVLQKFGNLLTITEDGDLIINGDLFDTFNIPYFDLLAVFEMLLHWLTFGGILYLVPGNHDLSKTTATMSSFQFLCKLLSSHPNVRIMDTPGVVNVAGQSGWVIPHVANQDLFDLELSRVPKGVKYLFLHCNFDNKFAQEKDNSLNLSQAQAEKLDVERIIMSHEHQRGTGCNGKVLIVGNQIPTSVADCLGNKDKYMLRITDKIEWLPVWEAAGSFERIDWHDAMKAAPASEFIRVEGEATASEGAAVAAAISKLRNVHNAFVITNAVTIEGRMMDGEKLSLEKIQSFNILDALLKRLNPAQQEVVTKLLKEHDVQTS